MAKQQKVKIKLPKTFKSVRDQLALAQQIRGFIVERSKRGLDKDDKPFAAYSGDNKKKGKYSADYVDSDDFDIYGKSKSKLNLQLSGDMLAEMRVLDTTSRSITIGYEAGDDVNGKVEGNRLGTYGNNTPVTKGRDFLGISEKRLNQIVKNFTPSEPEEVEPVNLRELIAFLRATKDSDA